ncbi:hypothetical protein E8E15_007434 [Penicillium rubens]|uniref:Uncharacterized protein n=1 Tax=Penicillium chrysogenum TaxID=5076 RepID=A0A167SBM3_PENCH|nr:uncharacterized protein N7525_009087 [Penicillium rubens]KAF3023918.1 hypothetical protein E8E15_007434 [Penicillium rubens]KAJ5830834.1 hypothetical protein N7525_009087 [Penicillium rubens]KAJ5854416.1 hypothetical protein N7534_006959 [Penicillium rubens]KZN86993.1 hypothetical protein EN45_055470 [Penicillium chrysogenum]
MATSVALGIGGWRLRKMWDSYDRNGPKEGLVYCHIGGNASHGTIKYPFTVLFGLRTGTMTFQRRHAAIDNANPPTRSYPQPGDSPVRRPPVPWAPRAIRATSLARPMRVPPHEATASTPPLQELELKVSATNAPSVAPFTFLCDN